MTKLRIWRRRKFDAERGTGAELALHPDFSSMSFHGLLDHGESKARARNLPAKRFLDLIKAFKDPLPVLRGDAGAVVGKLHHDRSVPRLGLHIDARGAEFKRV